jgi:hypothetical protein
MSTIVINPRATSQLSQNVLTFQHEELNSLIIGCINDLLIINPKLSVYYFGMCRLGKLTKDKLRYFSANLVPLDSPEE